jgi:hypothetical protein
MAKRHNGKNKLITRIDHRNTHGWNVRIVSDGHTHSKLFSDGVYGGKRKALDAARKHRDRLHRKLLGRPVPERREIRFGNARNTTGVVGVSLSVRQRGSAIYEYFVATWCPKKGRQARKAFSVNIYGRREAFRLACELRREKEREILGLQ